MQDEVSRNAVRAAQRKAVYDYNAEQASLARVAQAGFLRWLLSALTLIHFVSLLALHARGATPLAPHGAQWVFAIGLLMALLAGLFAWVNAALSAIVHGQWADVTLLDPDGGEAGESRAKKLLVHATNALTLLCAGLSCLAAPGAALLLAGG